MAGVAVTVEVGRLPEQLERVAEALQRGFWQRYAKTATNLLEREQGRHFSEQVSPGGEAWTPSRRSRKQHGLTLVDTGRLRNSLITGGGAGAVREVGPTHLIVGTAVKYGAIHQFGGEVTTPARRQTLIFGTSGRFISVKRAKARKAGAVRFRVVDIPERTFTVPARPFLGTSQRNRAELATAAGVAMNKTLREAAA